MNQDLKYEFGVQKRGIGCRHKFGIYWYKDRSKRLYRSTDVVNIDGVEIKDRVLEHFNFKRSDRKEEYEKET